jgi:hypothetical protein
MSTVQTPAAVAPTSDTSGPIAAALKSLLIDVCTALRDVSASPTVGNLSTACDFMEKLKGFSDVRATATLHAAKGEPRTLSALGWYRCLAKVEATTSAVIRYNARKA